MLNGLVVVGRGDTVDVFGVVLHRKLVAVCK